MGAVALVFLVMGYQLAVFFHRVTLTRLAERAAHPDTVWVARPAPSETVPPVSSEAARYMGTETSPHIGAEPPSPSPGEGEIVARRRAAAPVPVPRSAFSAQGRVGSGKSRRRVETFPFDPNTATEEEFCRLGFSQKQAQALLRYRAKGGRFHRKADFAKSFVVSDSVFARLEPYISIPRLDINQADSLRFLELPGVGPYLAGRMVAYRARLGGYSCVEQLLEIRHFDAQKLAALEELVTCSPPAPYPLWTLDAEALAQHPHISFREAQGIVRYRTNCPPAQWTPQRLREAGVLSPEHADKLFRCRLAPPPHL